MRNKRTHLRVGGLLTLVFFAHMPFGSVAVGGGVGIANMKQKAAKEDRHAMRTSEPLTLFMCGDVMTGRGIDQAFAHPSDPVLYESYMKNARGYLELAEAVNGPIPWPVSGAYIWGDALAELKRLAPDVRIINLETSITTSGDYWKGKGINYRMHPANVDALTEAGIDCCSLSNNHVLDWGYAGLDETLLTLQKAGIKSGGAGQTLREAAAPAVLETKGRGRVIVFSFGFATSGIPYNWAASEGRPGVYLLRDHSNQTVEQIRRRVAAVKQLGDVVVASVHWGGNWGYPISPEQRKFAHRLIDKAGIAVIHGHSSHHVKGIEVYKEKLILYGCGDFLNDYEGIGGYEEFRGDLALMYFATVAPATGNLLRLQMTPTQTRRFKVNRASLDDARWLRETLNREGAKLGTRTTLDAENRLLLHWR